jgi:hypothetical protein
MHQQNTSFRRVTGRSRIRRHVQHWLAATLLFASPASATPLIAELLYDAAGSDDGQSFVEIYGTPGESLDGMVLEGINGSNGQVVTLVELMGVVQLDGLFLVADADGGGGTVVPGYDQLANFDFQNGPDSVVLRRDTLVLDAVGYGVFDIGEIFAGEGAPADDAPAGSSLARVFADVDSDDNASDFVVQDVPTPGVAPIAGVPEPGAGLLTFAALTLLAARRRS